MKIILDDMELKTAIQSYLRTKGLEVMDVEKDITIPYTFFTAKHYPQAICQAVKMDVKK